MSLRQCTMGEDTSEDSGEESEEESGEESEEESGEESDETNGGDSTRIVFPSNFPSIMEMLMPGGLNGRTELPPGFSNSLCVNSIGDQLGLRERQCADIGSLSNAETEVLPCVVVPTNVIEVPTDGTELDLKQCLVMESDEAPEDADAEEISEEEEETTQQFLCVTPGNNESPLQRRSRPSHHEGRTTRIWYGVGKQKGYRQYPLACRGQEEIQGDVR